MKVSKFQLTNGHTTNLTEAKEDHEEVGMDGASVELKDDIKQEGGSKTPQDKEGGEENGSKIDVVTPFVAGNVWGKCVAEV